MQFVFHSSIDGAVKTGNHQGLSFLLERDENMLSLLNKKKNYANEVINIEEFNFKSKDVIICLDHKI